MYNNINEMITQMNDEAKLLKADIICFFNGIIIGTDIGVHYIKTIDQKANYPNMCFLQNDMNNIIKEHNKGLEIILNEKSIICGELQIQINNQSYINEVMHGFDSIYNNIGINRNNILYEKEIIRGDEEFEKILSSKAKDGVMTYRLSKDYIMILYGGLFPVNKSDKVGVKIYPYNEQCFHGQFIIDKKKKGIIELHIVCLKIL